MSYVVIDGTYLVREYIDVVDTLIEDLGYQLNDIMIQYSSYKYDPNHPNDCELLANRFYSTGTTSDVEDARILAKHAIRILYPAITQELTRLGYKVGLVHQAKIHVTRSKRMISCELLMKVV